MRLIADCGQKPVLRTADELRIAVLSGSGGETGRREGLKIPLPKGNAGSIPAPSTDRLTANNEASCAH